MPVRLFPVYSFMRSWIIASPWLHLRTTWRRMKGTSAGCSPGELQNQYQRAVVAAMKIAGISFTGVFCLNKNDEYHNFLRPSPPASDALPGGKEGYCCASWLRRYSPCRSSIQPGYSRGSALTASSSLSSSSLRRIPVAAMLSSSCSTRFAPIITLVTAF